MKTAAFNELFERAVDLLCKIRTSNDELSTLVERLESVPAR